MPSQNNNANAAGAGDTVRTPINSPGAAAVAAAGGVPSPIVPRTIGIFSPKRRSEDQASEPAAGKKVKFDSEPNTGPNIVTPTTAAPSPTEDLADGNLSHVGVYQGEVGSSSILDNATNIGLHNFGEDEGESGMKVEEGPKTRSDPPHGKVELEELEVISIPQVLGSYKHTDFVAEQVAQGKKHIKLLSYHPVPGSLTASMSQIREAVMGLLVSAEQDQLPHTNPVFCGQMATLAKVIESETEHAMVFDRHVDEALAEGVMSAEGVFERCYKRDKREALDNEQEWSGEPSTVTEKAAVHVKHLRKNKADLFQGKLGERQADCTVRSAAQKRGPTGERHGSAAQGMVVNNGWLGNHAYNHGGTKGKRMLAEKGVGGLVDPRDSSNCHAGYTHPTVEDEKEHGRLGKRIESFCKKVVDGQILTEFEDYSGRKIKLPPGKESDFEIEFKVAKDGDYVLRNLFREVDKATRDKFDRRSYVPKVQESDDTTIITRIDDYKAMIRAQRARKAQKREANALHDQPPPPPPAHPKNARGRSAGRNKSAGRGQSAARGQSAFRNKSNRSKSKGKNNSASAPSKDAPIGNYQKDYLPEGPRHGGPPHPRRDALPYPRPARWTGFGDRIGDDLTPDELYDAETTGRRLAVPQWRISQMGRHGPRVSMDEISRAYSIILYMLYYDYSLGKSCPGLSTEVSNLKRLAQRMMTAGERETESDCYDKEKGRGRYETDESRKKREEKQAAMTAAMRYAAGGHAAGAAGGAGQ